VLGIALDHGRFVEVRDKEVEKSTLKIHSSFNLKVREPILLTFL